MYAIYLEMRDFSIDLRNITQLGFTRNSPGPSGQLLRAPGMAYSESDTQFTHIHAQWYHENG